MSCLLTSLTTVTTYKDAKGSTDGNVITLQASKNTEFSEGSTNGYGVQVGVGASYGAQTGVYAYVGINASHGSSNSDGTTYNNTHLAADTITLKANNDITLAGADATANTINATAGDNLTIQSLQDNDENRGQVIPITML